MLQNYDARAEIAVDYMRWVHPGASITAGPLTDPKIPPLATTDPGFDAIVVSQETIIGAEAINGDRAKLGYSPLTVVVVGLIQGRSSSSGKLSSTDLRLKRAGANS